MSGPDLDRLAREADFSDHRLVAYLDSLDYADLVTLLQAPAVDTRIHMTPGKPAWSPGEPLPSLADEDPAVMVAIARCAVARWRSSERFGSIAATVMHPEPCGWCDYPAEQLQRALAWSEHYARLIEGEEYVWRRAGTVYRRATGRAGTYENTRWATFAGLPQREQRYLIDTAVAESKRNLDPPEDRALQADPPRAEHDPWCDLRSDHQGDCPNPSDADEA